jgi:stage II sporulation protein D
LQKRLTWLLIVLLLVVVVLPAVLVKGLKLTRPRTEIQLAGTIVKVKLAGTNTIKAFDVEDYLVGVVAAEMPARFETDALKAQAIAARTYSIRRLQESMKGNADHPGADLCTDPAHCQAWISDSEMRQRWGLVNYYRYKRRIVSVVRDTRGMVLTSNGSLINPVYHSTCGGKTENAAEVWKYSPSVPYLQSVVCPYDRESPKFHATVKFTWSELDAKLGTSLAANPGSASGKVKIRALTGTGRVKTIAFGSRLFAGTEVRSKLGLNSTRFTFKGDSRGLVIDTTGYGHGVGLCQYGANGYAKHGKDYRFILQHYYPGSKIQQLRY